MQLTRNQLINLPVISMTTGAKIGKTIDILVDTTTFKIGLVVIKSQFTQKYLLPSDIRNWDATKILISSGEVLSDQSDLIRFKNLIEDNFNLIGTPVETISQDKLGKVKSFSFDLLNNNIYKIFVQPKGVLKFLLKTQLVISREEIVEVKKDKLVVRDAVSRLAVRSKVVLPV